MQAIARGDQAERDRLFGSSRWVKVQVPDVELGWAHDAGVALVQGFTTSAAHRLGALEAGALSIGSFISLRPQQRAVDSPRAHRCGASVLQTGERLLRQPGG